MKEKLKQWTSKLKGRKINISKKERILLTILSLAVFLWVSYQFVFASQSIKINELKAERDSYEKKIEAFHDILANEVDIVNEWSSLREEFIRTSDKYFPTINQPEIMHFLNDIIDKGKIHISTIRFKGKEKVKFGDIEASSMEVEIPFKGSYKDLKDFIHFAKNSPKEMVINRISLSDSDDGTLSGYMALKVYTYEGHGDQSWDNYYYSSNRDGVRGDPFMPFEGYIDDEGVLGEDYDIGGDFEDYGNRVIIDNLKTNNIYFLGTEQGITGNVSRISKARFGNSSQRLEYFISTNYQPGRAYVVLDDLNLELKYPPSSIGVHTFSYGYSPVTLGLRFQDMDGNKIDLELVKGINWTGWEYISASPPSDINLYPLKLDRIYLELGPNRDDYGVLLFDRLEAEYTAYGEAPLTQPRPGYLFYVVKPGDTLMKISEDFYGDKSQYRRIMEDNGMDNSTLISGKVLVIKNK